MSKAQTTDKREIDLNGFVEVLDNPISCAGIYEYFNPPGCPEQGRVYRIYRPENELSKPETLDTLKLMPLVDDHTMLGVGETPAEKKGVHGVIGEQVYYKDGTIYGNIKILSTYLLDKIDNQGKKELSAGYWAEYDYTPGYWQGEQYDGSMRNIVFNHVALVDTGRMGSSVAVQDTKDLQTQPNGEIAMNEELLSAIRKAVMDAMEEKEKEKAEDMDDEEKEKTEDADDEKEKAEDSDKDDDETKDQQVYYHGKDSKEDDKKEGSMDAAMIVSIVEKQVAKALGSISEKSDLYSRVKAHTGVFDSAEMSVNSLAKYAVKKLGIEASAGQEVSALKGFLSAAEKFGKTQDSAHTNKVAATSINLKDFE